MHATVAHIVVFCRIGVRESGASRFIENTLCGVIHGLHINGFEALIVVTGAESLVKRGYTGTAGEVRIHDGAIVGERLIELRCLGPKKYNDVNGSQGREMCRTAVVRNKGRTCIESQP